MRLISFLITFILLIFPGQFNEILAQTKSVSPKRLPSLIPYRLGNLWGYADSTGKIKISPKYFDAEPFHLGFGKVKSPNGQVLIDSLGKEIYTIGNTSINLLNKELIKINNSVIDNNFDYRIISSDQYIYSFKEKKPLPFRNTQLEYHSPHDIGFPFLIVSETIPFGTYGGHRAYRTNHGLFKLDGKQILPLKFSVIEYLGEGLFSARNHDDLWMVINSEGNEIIPMGQNRPILFKEGLLVKCNENKCGYVDKNGKEIIPPIFQNAYAFSGGLAGISINGKWGYIDKTGKIAIKPDFDQVQDFEPKTGLAIVKKGKKFGLIYKDGTPVSRFEFEDLRYQDFPNAYSFLYKKEWFLAFPKQNPSYPPTPNKKLTKGKLLPGIFEDLITNYKTGVTNYGKVIISDKKPSSKGPKLYGIADKKNHVILPLKYEFLRILDSTIFLAGSGGDYNRLYGVVNSKGQEIIPLKYSKYINYRDGYAEVIEEQSTQIINVKDPDKEPPLKLPEGFKTYGNFEGWGEGIIKIYKPHTNKKRLY